MSSDTDADKRRVAKIGVSVLMLVVIVTAVTIGVTSTPHHEDEVSSSMKSIETVCAPTDYKEACVKSLEDSDTKSSDPKELIKAGLNSTIKHILKAAEKSKTLKEVEKDPGAKKALDICRRMMDYSMDELNTSFKRLGKIDIMKLDDALEDLNIWLSSVATFQETCLDGFENVTSEAGAKMKKALNMSMELTSNAIAMVSEISSIIGNLTIPGTKKSNDHHRRRLLQHRVPLEPDTEVPDWVGPTKRKLLAGSGLKPDLVVAKDGSGKYKTINAAIKDIPLESNKPFVLYVKAGVYNEKVTFGKKIKNLVLIGDGPTKTKITNNKNYAAGVKTWDTSTVTVLGDDFFARDIGFENTAGAAGHQAVALLVKSEKAVIYNCQMNGYQDTLYVPALRQFYRDCTISGTIDFVFGDAAAIFQNCKFLIRKPMPNQQCIVTAQGRKESRSRTGIILQGCTITGDSTYMAVKDQFKSYLGRPWKKFSRTIIMESNIDGIIEPEGWLPWAGNFALDTLYYSEFNNKGAGANTAKRVKWKGIRKLSLAKAMTYTPRRFFFDDAWITKRGIPYKPGMLS